MRAFARFRWLGVIRGNVPFRFRSMGGKCLVKFIGSSSFVGIRSAMILFYKQNQFSLYFRGINIL